MRNVRTPNLKGDQSCPICGSPLAVGAIYCESCGTDLSRSGVLISTEVRPATLPRHSKFSKLLKPARLKPVAAVAGALAVLIGLGGVPAVSARVPVLGTLYARSVGLVLGGKPAGPAPASSQPSENSTTFLMVRSVPSGAQVQVNDQQVGTTPLSVDLRPGTYRVLVSRQGYPAVSRTVEVSDGPVSLEVSLLGAEMEAPQEPQAPPAAQAPTPQAPPPQTALPPTPRSTPVRPPLAAGTKAPTLALKDRLGVIHRLEPGRGGKTAVLFVWTLNDQTRQAIRDLEGLVRNSGGRVTGLVVLMQGDRVALRVFVTTWQMKIPLLFGTPRVADQYHVASGVNMLYLVSERGTVERVQKGTIQPSGIIR